jgi:hypothetical protein
LSVEEVSELFDFGRENIRDENHSKSAGPGE